MTLSVVMESMLILRKAVTMVALTLEMAVTICVRLRKDMSAQAYHLAFRLATLCVETTRL